MKLLITGGHLAPALALIDEIKSVKPDDEIVFIGRKYALDSEKTLSLEFKEIEKLNIRFYSMTAGRLTRFFSLRSIINFLKIPIGFIQAFFFIREIKPDVVMSFGSYLALPVVFWAYIFRIPVFTHEQTITPGLANRLIGYFANKIFISFRESADFFNSKKTILSGNPIKKSVKMVVNKPFSIIKDRPVIYITGGSLGSHSINIHIQNIINELLKEYIVIHQTGDTREYHDFENLNTIREKLPVLLKNRYFLRKHFFENEMGYVYSISDLVIGRSGANAYFELLALKKPAILIPLPWSAGHEQQKHAEIFAKNGIGEIFHQIEPSHKLYRLIKTVMKNHEYYKKNFSKLNSMFKQNASKIIIEQIFS